MGRGGVFGGGGGGGGGAGRRESNICHLKELINSTVRGGTVMQKKNNFLGLPGTQPFLFFLSCFLFFFNYIRIVSSSHSLTFWLEMSQYYSK